MRVGNRSAAGRVNEWIPGSAQDYSPKASAANSTMWAPMARDDVAPGDGAFKTWTAYRPRMMLKSSSNAPLRETA